MAGGSNASQCWLPPDIKQEKEEEEEQPVSQRGDLLDFTDQDHYRSVKEENQDPEQHTDDPVRREEPDSASATNDKQVSVHDFMMNRLHNETKDTNESRGSVNHLFILLLERKSERRKLKHSQALVVLITTDVIPPPTTMLVAMVEWCCLYFHSLTPRQ